MSLQIDALLQAAAVAAVLLALAYKLPSVRRHSGDLGLRAFTACIVLTAAALVVLVDPAHSYIDALIGVPNLASVQGDCLAAGSACATLCLLAYLNYPPDRAHRINLVFAAITFLVVALMNWLFFSSPFRPETPNYWTLYGGDPAIATLRLVFLGFIAFVLLTMARLTLRFAAISTRRSMKLGMQLVAAGGAVGELWVVLEVARTLVQVLGASQPPLATETLGRILVAALLTLIAIGATLPSWGPRLGFDSAQTPMGEYLSLHRLYALWRTLGELTPGVALMAPRSRFAEAIDLRDIHFRLYRRVVEMRDAILLVKRSSDPRATERATAIGLAKGLRDDDLDLMVTATQIVLAVRGRHPGGERQGTKGASAAPQPADLPAEVRWLERLARWYRRSALLRMVSGIDDIDLVDLPGRADG
ncbi:MAG TPA: MAB_1171c family putative transporter [Candidatus Dormibacteraeota bacterium]